VPDPPVPTGTVTDTVLPAVKVEDCKRYNCAGDALDPENRNSWYEERSEIDGAIPESAHVTVKAVPPAMLAPAAGTEKATSAQTKEADASTAAMALDRRMIAACTLSAKRVNLCEKLEWDYSWSWLGHWSG
jgi:hypothetical protein